ncbi:hypothetical protein [Francisella tularensis]|uniref:hypothetical protein n=1 Tax=Francisella tularensis TaxID=263 RepID=UPI001F2B6565|nr:hypothetical protein [Francisella tularensis]
MEIRLSKIYCKQVASSISNQSTQETKNQFINSLKDNSFIKDIIDSTFNTGAEDALVDIALDIAERTRQAEQTRVFSFDPLTFDLDGDGIETVSVEQGVLFDHQSTGVKEGTGWVSSDDGLLVRDIDGSGTIDNGQELFGDNTIKADGTKATDGFDALADLDSNSDGVFDSSDSAFDEVQVWQDKDQDGITDAGELTSLTDAGIDSIDLNAKTVNQSVAGGILRKTSTATKLDGTTAAVGAMDFAENKFYSKFEEVLQSSQDLQNSINVAGQGALRSSKVFLLEICKYFANLDLAGSSGSNPEKNG